MIKYLRKVIKSGVEGFVRQGFLSFATSLVIFIAVTLTGALYFFQGAVNYLTGELEGKIDISVTFKEDVSQDAILQIREDISKLPEVKRADYVSPEEAYNAFVTAHQGDQYMEALGLISINPFLPTLRIQTYEPSQYKEVSEYLNKDEYKNLITEVNDYKRGTVIEKLGQITSNIRVVGFSLTLFLSLIALIITFNTVRLSIYSQKDEIEIMRLVGAKNSFIRGPFLVQGFLCGVFAAILSFAIFFAAIMPFGMQLKNIFMDFDVYAFFMSNIWIILSLDLLVGVGLGLISSYFAVRKYLRD